MKLVKQIILVSLILIVGLSFSCKKSTDDTGTGGGTATVPAVYQKIYGATSITSDGIYITIKTNGMPDHKSAYYPTSNSLYEVFSGTTFGGNTFNTTDIFYFNRHIIAFKITLP